MCVPNKYKNVYKLLSEFMAQTRHPKGTVECKGSFNLPPIDKTSQDDYIIPAPIDVIIRKNGLKGKKVEIKIDERIIYKNIKGAGHV